MSTRRSRSEIVREVESTQPWAEVFVGSMDEHCQHIFRCRKAALDLYVAGEDIRTIYESTHISCMEIHRLIKRCLKVSKSGLVFGYKGLIPQLVLRDYTRKAPSLPKFPECRYGYAGVLSQVFSRYPGLKDFLDDKILKRKSRSLIHEFAIRPKALHKYFIDFLRKNNHPENEWPFSTQYKGYRSIVSYAANVRSHNFDRAIIATGTNSAIAHLCLGAGFESLLRFDDFMSVVEVDSYKIDANFVIGINNAEGLKTFIGLKRLNILALVERASNAVLWYHVVYSPEVCAQDIVRLIAESMREKLPKPESNRLELKLDPGAGFPAEQIPAMRHAIPDVLMPDNALANLSSAVSQTLRKELGFALCYGAPGHFEIRPNVERTFKNLATSLFQRFPNTTGSKPSAGHKGVEVALKYEMEADVLEELAYFHFARHNITMSEGISFLTPLDFIRQKLELDRGHCMVRTLPRHAVDRYVNYRIAKTVKVKCYPERGVRPFIQLDRVRYTNNVLRSSPWLKDELIVINIDEQDMRVVHAFLSTGESLGVLKASGLWGRTKHGRKTRQAINKLCATKLLQFSESEDPVHKYLEYVAAQSMKIRGRSCRSKQNSVMGTELNRLRIEMSEVSELPDCPKREVDVLLKNESEGSGAYENVPLLNSLNSLMPRSMPDLKKLLRRS